MGARRIRDLIFVLGVVLSTAAHAQSPSTDAATAVRLARAAFEYRDFQKVVHTLDPWLHPPRIVDETLEMQARELLGVSLHVLGRQKAAEEEFAQLLELAPTHELDPFVVPPPVIQTFEEVRAKMKPALDAIQKRKAGAEPAPPARVRTELVQVPHPAMALAPFGIAHFALDETGWGTMWAVLQGAGIVVNVLGWAQAERTDTRADFRAWSAVQYSGLALWLGGWGAASLHAYLDIDDRASPPPPAPPGPGVSWRWRF